MKRGTVFLVKMMGEMKNGLIANLAGKDEQKVGKEKNGALKGPFLVPVAMNWISEGP